ncbi:hypothetical protein [Desulfoluna sp.]|uniref:hypothetical protein n=1 Tax=Desulfoluna sp. TaxID=2045199 RepID=UPI002635D818|nr:hypothetical protein [Desulfoluna sp.]
MGKAKAKRVFTFKRCPYCFTNLSLTAETCLGCHKRVGKVDRFGLAKKPINYLGYLAAFMWVGIFIGYIWFAFIR